MFRSRHTGHRKGCPCRSAGSGRENSEDYNRDLSACLKKPTRKAARMGYPQGPFVGFLMTRLGPVWITLLRTSAHTIIGGESPDPGCVEYAEP